MSQKYAQCDTNGNVIAYYDDAINPAAQIGTAIRITDAQWQDSVANPGKYIISNGALTLAPPPTAAQIAAQQWAAYQAGAKELLAACDVTMHRIVEAVALGKTTWTALDVAAFAQYRQQLRAILSQAQPATIPAAYPAKPPFPAGT